MTTQKKATDMKKAKSENSQNSKKQENNCIYALKKILGTEDVKKVFSTLYGTFTKIVFTDSFNGKALIEIGKALGIKEPRKKTKAIYDTLGSMVDSEHQLYDPDIPRLYYLMWFFEQDEKLKFKDIQDALHFYTHKMAAQRYKDAAKTVKTAKEPKDEKDSKRVRRAFSLFTYLYLCEACESKQRETFFNKAKVEGYIADAFDEAYLPTDEHTQLSDKQKAMILKIEEAMQEGDGKAQLFLNLRDQIKSPRKRRLPVANKLLYRFGKQLKEETENVEEKCTELAKTLDALILQLEKIPFSIPGAVVKKVLSEMQDSGETLTTVNVILKILEKVEDMIVDAAREDYFATEYNDTGRLWYIRDYLYLNSSFAEDGNRCELAPDISKVFEHSLSQIDRAVVHISKYSSDVDLPTRRDILNMLIRVSYEKLRDNVQKGTTVEEKRSEIRKFAKGDFQEDEQYWLEACVETGLMQMTMESDTHYEFVTPTLRLYFAGTGLAEDLSHDGADTILAEIEKYFSQYFCKVPDQGVDKDNHLTYLFSEFGVFGMAVLLSLNYKTQREITIKIASKIKNAIRRKERTFQKAYIVLMALLLLQNNFHCDKEVRKNLCEALFATNAYPQELALYRLLVRKDPFFLDFPKQEFSNAFVNIREDSDAEPAYPPPFFIYYWPIFSEYESRVKTVELSETEMKCYRVQHDTWAKPRNVEEDINALISQLNDEFSLEGARADKLITTSYAAEMLLMGISNMLRASEESKLNYATVLDGLNYSKMFEMMVSSEYIKRKFSAAYWGDGRLWLQSGGFRVTSELQVKQPGMRIESIPIDEEKRELFTKALKKEADTQQWRFFFLLSRLLMYTDYFSALEPVGKEDPNRAETFAEKIVGEFLPYDHMKKSFIKELLMECQCKTEDVVFTVFEPLKNNKTMTAQKKTEVDDLFIQYGYKKTFGREDVAKCIAQSIESARRLINKMAEAGLIEKVKGPPKGHYKFVKSK